MFFTCQKKVSKCFLNFLPIAANSHLKKHSSQDSENLLIKKVKENLYSFATFLTKLLGKNFPHGLGYKSLKSVGKKFFPTCEENFFPHMWGKIFSQCTVVMVSIKSFELFCIFVLICTRGTRKMQKKIFLKFIKCRKKEGKFWD